jgi:PBP1b-binding outer membrane lipoprotein LpoB
MVNNMKKLILLLATLLFLAGCADGMSPVLPSPPAKEEENGEIDFYEYLPHRIPCEGSENDTE